MTAWLLQGVLREQELEADITSLTQEKTGLLEYAANVERQHNQLLEWYNGMTEHAAECEVGPWCQGHCRRPHRCPHYPPQMRTRRAPLRCPSLLPFDTYSLQTCSGLVATSSLLSILQTACPWQCSHSLQAAHKAAEDRCLIGEHSATLMGQQLKDDLRDVQVRAALGSWAVCVG